MIDRLTEKQIAQTYYLDDIILHEVILESLQQLDKQVSKHPVSWTKSDLVYKLVNLSMENEFMDLFHIEPNELIKAVHSDYNKELDELCLRCQH